MKSKKVTMLAAALVVAVVAAAGIGFATTYTAKTTNSGNTLDSTYITVSQSGAALYAEDFLSSIYFDTVNTATKNVTTESYDQQTTYTPVADYQLKNNAYTNVIGEGETATYSRVSNGLTLEFAKQNVPTSEQSVRLEVEVTNFTPVNGLVYTMVLTDSAGTSITPVENGTATITGTSQTTGTTQTFAFTSIDITSVTSFDVYLFISLASGAITDATNITHAGFNVGTNADSVFTFTAIVNYVAPSP